MLGAITAPEATLLAAAVGAVASLLTSVIFRYFVDARVLSIFEGANEIQAQVVARRLLE